MKNIVYLLVCLSLVLCGCNRYTPDNTVVIKHMNVTDASAIYLAPASHAKHGKKNIIKEKHDEEDSPNVLFKVTDDGSVEQVIYSDADGKEIKQTKYPKKVITISNSPYFFVLFDHEHYLVNANTGAVYEWMNGHYTKDNPCLDNRYVTQVETDANGNIYIFAPYIDGGNLVGGKAISKVDISDENHLTVTRLTPLSHDVSQERHICVSDDGDVLYEASNPETDVEAVYLLTRTGRINTLASLNRHTFAFKDLQGKIRSFYCDDILQRINVDEQGNVSVDDISCDLSEYTWVEEMWHRLFTLSTTDYYSKCAMIIRGANRLMLIDDYSRCLIIESNNSDELISATIINGGKQIVCSTIADDKLYCVCHEAGRFSLNVVNCNTMESTTIFDDSNYEIYSLFVQTDGSVIFNGLRLSDYATIIAQITESREMIILDEIENNQIRFELQPIR